jgi:hypothetical protein
MTQTNAQKKEHFELAVDTSSTTGIVITVVAIIVLIILIVLAVIFLPNNVLRMF